jgi:hypothetical protein
MDKELETYYNNYFELFLTEGWKQLVIDLENNIKSFNVSSLKDSEELFKAQGSLNVLYSLSNLESTIKNAFEEITNSDSPLEEDD